MKKYIFAGIIIFLVVITSIILFLKQDLKKVYIASGHPEWKPVMWKQDDKIVGVGADLVSLIAKDLKLNIQFKYVGRWDVVHEKSRKGEVDLLVGAYKTAERETYLDYSEAYAVDPMALFVKKGKNFAFEKWDDLLPESLR